MRFPNLSWAIAECRLAHYQAATAVHMSESKFSRCLSGRACFSAQEQEKLATALGYPVTWLFQKASPPGRVSRLAGGSGLRLD
jgi:hypothetical protein